MKHGDKILATTEFILDSVEYIPHTYMTYIDCKNKVVKALLDDIEYFIPQECVILKQDLHYEIF